MSGSDQLSRGGSTSSSRALRRIRRSVRAKIMAVSSGRAVAPAPPLWDAPPPRLATLSEADIRPQHRRSNPRSEEHTSELQSLMRISYAVFCLKKKKKMNTDTQQRQETA